MNILHTHAAEITYTAQENIVADFESLTDELLFIVIFKNFCHSQKSS